MAASHLQIMLLIVGGTALAFAARHWQIRLLSPASREAALIVTIVGWLAVLLGWSFVLREAAGDLLGLALWISSLIVVLRLRERRAAIGQAEQLSALIEAMESGLSPANAIDALPPGGLEVLSPSGRTAAALADASTGALLLNAAANWDAERGLIREELRTRLVYSGMVLSITLVAIAAMVSHFGSPLQHLADDLAARLPERIFALAATLGAAAAWLGTHPLQLLAATWLMFVPWLYLAVRWRWLTVTSSRLWLGSGPPADSLLLKLLSLARIKGRTDASIAAAMVGTVGTNRYQRCWQRVADACAAGQSLWSPLGQVGLLPRALAESLLAAERQSAISERSREVEKLLARREQTRLRSMSAALTLGCVVCAVLAVLLVHLIIWLPLLKLSVPQ